MIGSCGEQMVISHNKDHQPIYGQMPPDFCGSHSEYEVFAGWLLIAGSMYAFVGKRERLIHAVEALGLIIFGATLFLFRVGMVFAFAAHETIVKLDTDTIISDGKLGVLLALVGLVAIIKGFFLTSWLLAGQPMCGKQPGTRWGTTSVLLFAGGSLCRLATLPDGFHFSLLKSKNEHLARIQRFACISAGICILIAAAARWCLDSADRASGKHRRKIAAYLESLMSPSLHAAGLLTLIMQPAGAQFFGKTLGMSAVVIAFVVSIVVIGLQMQHEMTVRYLDLR